MIKGITGGKYLQVNGGQAGSTYINNYSGGQGVGNMRYNTSTQNFEVFDGNNWIIMSTSYATVDLTFDAQQALEWVQEKRLEEMKWKELAEMNTAVKIALDNLEQARQQLDITAKLAREYETKTS